MWLCRKPHSQQFSARFCSRACAAKKRHENAKARHLDPAPSMVTALSPPKRVHVGTAAVMAVSSAQRRPAGNRPGVWSRLRQASTEAPVVGTPVRNMTLVCAYACACVSTRARVCVAARSTSLQLCLKWTCCHCSWLRVQRPVITRSRCLRRKMCDGSRAAARLCDTDTQPFSRAR